MMDALEVAEAFFKAIETQDIEALGRLYADDMLLWHNYDVPLDRSTGEDKAGSLRVLTGLPVVLDDYTYDVQQRERTETGFVQQHILRGTMKNGTPFALPACVICVVENGQITRLDEYFDPAKNDELVEAYREAQGKT